VAVEMTQAVLLIAYGSPSRLEDVPAYFSDIRGGRPVRQEAVDELVEKYRRLGLSPLDRITETQRAALERTLGIRCYVGMKHWRPWIAETVEEMLADGVLKIVGLVLAPHYSRLSIGGYRERLESALGGRAEVDFVESWHDWAPYVDVVASRIRGANAHVVFTAHSLPERILAEGDPYRDQLLETARLAAERAGVQDWSLAFQSESATGEPWLGPDILVHLEQLRADGIESVLVAPIGFVSDHLEVLWDIDVEARGRALELGLGLRRIESMNDDPAFIDALARLVSARIAAWEESHDSSDDPSARLDPGVQSALPGERFRVR
jgi:ferrochelatase